jgi:hypothetical protein
MLAFVDAPKAEINQRAVDEFIQILEEERTTLEKTVEDLGGVLADRRLSPSEFATKTAERIEEEARVFPRVGMQRGTDHRIDMLTMTPEQLHYILKQFDPERAESLLASHGGIEGLRELVKPENQQRFTDTVTMYMNQIEPFLSDEPKLRYMKDLFGKEIPKPKKTRKERREEQEDMFGADLTKQQLADLRRKKDRARDTGQEELETGDVGDLFSEARRQEDIEDVSGWFRDPSEKQQNNAGVVRDTRGRTGESRQTNRGRRR